MKHRALVAIVVGALLCSLTANAAIAQVAPRGGATCLDWAFCFGMTTDDFAVPRAAAEISIGMRNATDSFGFSLGVSTRGDAWEFTGDLGANEVRPVALVITDTDGMSNRPVAANSVTSSAEPVDIVRGATIAAFASRDFLTFEMAPAVGGPGFYVAYVSDFEAGTNRIPATAEDGCLMNEILIVRLDAPAIPFSRGDCNGDGACDMADSIYVLNGLFVGGAVPRCLAAADVNGDAGVDIADPVYLLNYHFLGGPPPAVPFPDCGTSELAADASLGCEESACP